ncbi:MAG TPA: hypothetical protein VGO92_05940, partial [Acidimicrobiales bacterium]|nr:hypothetical protein [Acidimicrobiales bacterium]
MTDWPRQRWEQRNTDYLADALAWLRDRLAGLGEPTAIAAPTAPPPPTVPLPPPAPKPAPPDPRPRSFWTLFFSRAGHQPEPAPGPASEASEASEPSGPQPAPPPEPEPEAGSPTAAPAPAPARSPAASAAAEADAVGEPPPAHVELARRLGLSDFERDVLLLAVGAELDPRIGPLCGRAQPGHAGAFPTFALALRLFDQPTWDALGPHGLLRRLQLVTVDAEPGVVNGRLRADERVVNFVKGFDHLDERLAALLAPMATGEGEIGIAPSQQAAVDAVRARIEGAPGGPVVVNLVGPDSVSKRLVAERAATEVGRYPLRVPITNLPGPGRDLDTVIRLWERDALLSPVALYLDASDDVGDAAVDTRASVDRLLSRAHGLVFLDTREVWSNLGPGMLVLDVPGPTTAEQRTAWSSMLGPDRQATAAGLAAQFDLDLLSIRSLVVDDEGDDDDKLWQAALRNSRPRLDLLALRVEPKARAEDLVLPDEVLSQIGRIKEQVRHRAVVHADWGLSER